MKRLKLVSVFVLGMVMLSSCSSDDDGGFQGIVGTWELSSFTLENDYDFNNDGTAISNVLIETSCVQGNILKFNSDNTGTFSNTSTALDIDFNEVTLDYYEYEIYCDPINISIGFTWIQEGNTIITTSILSTDVFTLSGSELTTVVTDGMDVPVIINNDYSGYSLEDTTFIYTKQ